MRLPLAVALAAVTFVTGAAPATSSFVTGTTASVTSSPQADGLLPFPNDRLTVADPSTPTGRRLALPVELMPVNSQGVAVDPAEWNTADGFSPGSMVLARVPGIDLGRTGAAPVTDIGRSLRRDAPILLLDTRTGERWPYWAELDVNAPADRQALIIRPARNLREGHTYAVVLRHLKDAAGAPIPSPQLSQLPSPQQGPLPEVLRRHGIGADGLYLAWTFTVASQQGLAGRALAMRDDALSKLGDRSPAFTVSAVTDFTAEQDPRIARRVEGTFRVPSYLDQPGGPPGSGLNYGPDGLPAQLPGNEQVAPFRCEIPRRAFDRPVRVSLYGHGLLGRQSEVGASNVKTMAQEHGFAFCATKWIGMADEDIPAVLGAFGELSRFHVIPDRAQQGLINTMFLGRAMLTGFAADPAFQGERGRPLIDVRKGLVYDGNSQGGIMGGALLALSKDIRRGVLGVPGMNYSLLFHRSSDAGPFQQVLDGAYPDRLDQQILLSLVQILWDRGEANGYAAHMTGDPYRGTPSHRVLMHVAYADHQVTTVSADIEARTIGARVMTPVLAAGRSPDVVPYWGIQPIRGPLHPGSAMVVWDSGTPVPPTTNTPPTQGADPHEDPRRTPAAQLQKSIFLKTGVVVDVCDGEPCRSVPPE